MLRTAPAQRSLRFSPCSVLKPKTRRDHREPPFPCGSAAFCFCILNYDLRIVNDECGGTHSTQLHGSVLNARHSSLRTISGKAAQLTWGSALRSLRCGLSSGKAAASAVLTECLSPARCPRGKARRQSEWSTPLPLLFENSSYRRVNIPAGRFRIFRQRIAGTTAACRIADEDAALNERGDVAQGGVAGTFGELRPFGCRQLPLEAFEGPVQDRALPFVQRLFCAGVNNILRARCVKWAG